ncbi:MULTISPECIES: class I SAM-dependent methyltransferase [unclassified Mesorhizobium]|uniref:O-methyltransferase n=1 Tax=unclassified Mesorhizobium TaxID=325217 RepID=UPI000FD27E77|nr:MULTISPECIES: class I SAM-dependent methyltransferase [unclassified Mesorhizobium]RVB80552.1 class I SAM-dependent methyltransferase [Mesorhizobium sp. M6A.T.Cr.TU.014.01.1.1]RWP97590.1 MAG: class I SAM-dependent methyltransferase [Mesorhizobium sp.]RWQ10862.1 MAG: class I SAM-dependent methyltransferase [Mesorhizobium sp.]
MAANAHLTYHSDRAITVGQFQPNMGYKPNYSYAGPDIDEFQTFLRNCPMRGSLIDIGIPGWLRREDALKLYELARFAEGDILEFGTNEGLSAYILANAVANSGRKAEIVSMELSPEISATAHKNLTAHGVNGTIRLEVGDADATCQRLVDSNRKFGFSFIDHSHAYEHVVKACHRLKQLIEPGSFCVFHDYNDKRNSRRTGLGETSNEYGIIAGIEDSLDTNLFEFVGIYGCCGVFRRKDI